MIEPQTRRRLIGGSLFVFIAGLIIFMRLLPLSPGKVTLPGPDLLLCLTFAWVLRRPGQVPPALIAAVFLFEDIMLMRPIGLWAFFVLLATEALRAREHRWRDQAFVFEWARIAVLIALMLLGARVMMALLMVPLPALGQVILQYFATVICYPLAVLVGHWLLGLRRASPVEAELMRNR